MAKYIDADKSVGIGYLSDWYQSSIDDTKPPIWTDEHIEELTNDFIVIPKDTPTADVVEVKHGYWKDIYGNKYANHLYECSVCGEKPLYKFYTNELGQTKTRQALTPGCPHCLAVMDGKDNNVPTK